MNKEGPPLVPLERVAVPTVENTDKATRKMIAQVEKTLAGRFGLQTTGNGVEFHTLRFIEMINPSRQSKLLGSLRVNQKDYALNSNQPVRIITGMCFFGTSGLAGETPSGRVVGLADPIDLETLNEPIVAIKENQFLHLSEAETITTVSDALKVLATGEVSVFFHLPKTEYKLYMLESFNKGLLTAEQVADLFSRVDRRADDLAKIVAKRFPVKPTFGSPLDVLEPVLNTFKEKTTIEQCLAAVPKDSVMGQLIKMYQAVPIASSSGILMGMGQILPKFTDLNKLAYTAGYIGLAQAAAADNEGFLAVDMSQESPIFDNSKHFAEQLGLNLPLAVLLLPPQLVTLNGKHFKDSTFMHQSDNTQPLTELRAVVSNRRGLNL